ncbi:cytochrome P450 302a1, mitochondrial-like isoform X2 [Thrips palmi]|nr:cytochrome P450 302a1, mitochondrial-like isoform X2 [Thrips palmi]XP_034244459.1 cytochrome P450 302a1, mitochondrial-like isoform X2 [Thrips palmi]XP_034244460.1 cytochrome P450 302a1, mitochondrial-like isoform X2 [Thrips palmi]
MRLATSSRFLTQTFRRHHLKPLVSVRTSVSLAEDPKCHPEQSVKKFHEIPGPKSLPVVGTIYLYLMGVYSFTQLHKTGLKKYLKYGPIVREEIVPGNSVVWIFDPNDMEHLFLSENNLPQRRSHLAVGVLRKDRPHVYNTGGLLTTNGEDWWKLRKEFQKGFSAPQAVRAYLPVTDNIIQEFVASRLMQQRDDYLPELSRLFLQLTCLVAFDKKFDCFSTNEMKPDSMSSRLMDAALTTNSLVLTLDNEKNVKKARSWKKFESAMLYMEDVAVELVKEKADSLAKENKEESENTVPSLLELYLSSPNLDYKDVVGMSVDLLLAGIDTTAYTASFALYYLAKNERVQNFLRLESQKILQSPEDPVTAKTLANAPYARAVLKEVFRMSPISVGVGRIATQDIVLSGYNVPKGTNIVTQNQISCRLEKYFARPNEFLPERWIKGSPLQVKDNPFLVLPFGHGPRSCIARRLAEQHLLTLLLRIVHNHKIIWTSKKELDCKTLLINKPDQELKFTFSKITN